MEVEEARQYVMKHFQAGKDEVIQRYEAIVRAVSRDPTASKLFDQLLEDAERYFGVVVRLEYQLASARFRIEGAELRELTETLDRSRHHAHNALISSLHAFNRYVVKEYEGQIPEGGIFPNPEAIHDRIAVADWAGDLLCSLYRSRRR